MAGQIVSHVLTIVEAFRKLTEDERALAWYMMGSIVGALHAPQPRVQAKASRKVGGAAVKGSKRKKVPCAICHRRIAAQNMQRHIDAKHPKHNVAARRAQANGHKTRRRFSKQRVVLSEDQRRELITDRLNGMPTGEAAKKYSISTSTVRDIQNAAIAGSKV